MKGGLGNMPLTLFVIVAAIVMYLHIRRSSLGIDTHPGEAVSVKPAAPKPSVFIGPLQPLANPPLPGQPGFPGIAPAPAAGNASGGLLQ